MTWPNNPVGCLSTAEAVAAQMLAACAAFQSLVGAADATEALPCIYGSVLPGFQDPETGEIARVELERLRPFGMVSVVSHRSRKRTQGAGNSQDHAAELHVRIEQGDAPDEDAAAWEREFKDLIGQIGDQLDALPREYPYGDLVEVEHGGVWRIHRDDVQDLGDHMFADMVLRFGSLA